MFFDRWTDRARKTLALARKQAERFNHEFVTPDHLLLGFIQEEGGVGILVLQKAGIDLARMKDEIEKRLAPYQEPSVGQIPFSPLAKKVLEYSIDAARQMDHGYVGTEHLLLGLLSIHNGPVAEVLGSFKLEKEACFKAIVEFLGENPDKQHDDAASSIPNSEPTAAVPSVPLLRAFFGKLLEHVAGENSKFFSTVDGSHALHVPVVKGFLHLGRVKEAREYAAKISSGPGSGDSIDEKMRCHLAIGIATRCCEDFDFALAEALHISERGHLDGCCARAAILDAMREALENEDKQ